MLMKKDNVTDEFAKAIFSPEFFDGIAMKGIIKS
jgi:hypothetical protein